MRTVLFGVGFLVGAGGALLLLAAVLSTLFTALSWLRSAVASQRTAAREHQRPDPVQPARRRQQRRSAAVAEWAALDPRRRALPHR